MIPGIQDVTLQLETEACESNIQVQAELFTIFMQEIMLHSNVP